MPTAHKLRSLAKALSLAVPLAALTIPLSAAPIEILSAACGALDGVASPSDSSSCSNSTSQGNVTKSLTYFSNGFTLSLSADGSAWTSAGQGGAFTLDAEVPVSVAIAGSSRSLAVFRDVSQSETLDAPAGAIGQVFYGFQHFTVISRRPNGTDPITFDFAFTTPTSMQTWTSDDVSNYNFGLSMQLTGVVTAGGLSGSISESETFRFFEADGVTPVNLLVAEAPEPASLLLPLGSVPVCCFVSRRRRPARASQFS